MGPAAIGDSRDLFFPVYFADQHDSADSNSQRQEGDERISC